MEIKRDEHTTIEAYIDILPPEILKNMYLSSRDMISVSLTCRTLWTFNDARKLDLLIECFKLRDVEAIKQWLLTGKTAIRLILTSITITDLTEQCFKKMSLYQHTFYTQDKEVLKLLHSRMSIEDELQQQRAFYEGVKSQQFSMPFTLDSLISVIEAHLNKLNTLTDKEAADDCFKNVQPVQQALPAWFVLYYYRIPFNAFSVQHLSPREVELNHLTIWYQIGRKHKRDYIYTKGECGVPYAFASGFDGISGGLFCNDRYGKSFIKLFFTHDLVLLKSLSSSIKEEELLIKSSLYAEGAGEIRKYCRGSADFFQAGRPDLIKIVTLLKSYQSDPNLCLRNLAHSNKIKELLLLLKYFDVNLNSQSASNKKTALHYAASKGHLEVVKLLVSKGADSSIKDDQDKTPMEVANSSCQQWLASNPPLTQKHAM